MTVPYHECHDEAGNAKGSARTMVVAVNGAPLVGPTRFAAEARSRVAFGLALLSAGTPMFFMGEEIGARKRYTYDSFLQHREDILGERAGHGAPLFRFYQDLITLGGRLRSIRGRDLHVVHCRNDTRVLAFKRWDADEQVLVVASLNNAPFAGGYAIQADTLSLPDGSWREIFNSDAALYGGANVGNAGATIVAHGGGLQLLLPANGLVVLVAR